MLFDKHIDANAVVTGLQVRGGTRRGPNSAATVTPLLGPQPAFATVR
jgi:hypothetical protein